MDQTTLLAKIKYYVGPLSIAQMKNLSTASGVAYPTIYRIARGLVNSPRGRVLQKLERAIWPK